ncbi:MAG: glycosyltransferase [Candidatus Omnitrophica bacterium]|nr:glycosyltransferase [Candidatus Omnitrophota bacterium]
MNVSIITVCYNAANCIEEAIKSVLAQSYKKIEYIIVDGQSTDGTMDIIDKYRDRISTVISERDNGIWDAMNKGIRTAQGDIIYFLNSDDRLYDNDVINDVIKEIDADPEAGLFYGKVRFVNVPRELEPYINEVRHIETKNDFLSQGICHQSIFTKKWVFDKAGCFNTKYLYADFDWLLSVYDSSVKMKLMDRYICFYYYMGFSFKNANDKVMERAEIIYKHFPLHVFLFYILRYVLLRTINSKRKDLLRYLRLQVKN